MSQLTSPIISPCVSLATEASEKSYSNRAWELVLDEDKRRKKKNKKSKTVELSPSPNSKSDDWH